MKRISKLATLGWERLVYHYGLREPLDWGADCERQMWLMRDFWNALVAIGVDYRRRYEEAVRSSEVAAIERQLAAAAAALDAAIAERRRVAAGAGKAAVPAALSAAVTAHAAECKLLRAALKEARRQVRVMMAQTMEDLRLAQDAAIKAARQAANAAGCWWGNANAVLASYQRMRGRLMREGRQFQERSRASNRIVNQIIGGVTVADLLGGNHSQVRIAHNPDAGQSERRRRWRLLTATVFCARDEGAHFRRAVTWPMIVSRHRDIGDLPPASRVQEVTIQRTRVADRWDWSVSFLIYAPPATAAAPARANAACGIDVGWRLIDDSIRVATIVSTAQEKPSYIVLPPSFMRDNKRLDELRSRRAENLTAVLVEIRQLKFDDALPALAAAATGLRSLDPEAIKPRHVMPLVHAWRQSPQWQPAPREEIMRWARQDRQDWQEFAGLHRRIVTRRRELVHREIKRLVEGHGLIGIEDIDFGALIRQTKAENADPRLAASGHVRKLAAPGEFLKYVAQAAARHNVSIHRHAGRSSGICPSCATVFAPPDRASLYYTCPHCSHVYDQDAGAAAALLSAALAASAPLPTDGAAALATWKSSDNNQLATSP